jgi:hypothetical protein
MKVLRPIGINKEIEVQFLHIQTWVPNRYGVS